MNTEKLSKIKIDIFLKHYHLFDEATIKIYFENIVTHDFYNGYSEIWKKDITLQEAYSKNLLFSSIKFRKYELFKFCVNEIYKDLFSVKNININSSFNYPGFFFNIAEF